MTGAGEERGGGVSNGDEKRHGDNQPDESQDEGRESGGRESLPSYAPAAPLSERLERERRRAIRAEGRLAEIELRLRRELERANGEGVSVGTLQSLLEAVQARVISLEDELRSSERELMGLVSAQRRSLGALAADDEDVAFGLEQSRRELREEVESQHTGLPELTRQRLEFEVELDRLQSLLNYRDSVCDGLAEELEQGTRVTAEVTARLADLSRGRVAPARRLATQDARVATLRRNLESEQMQLRQARRALEAARAELKVAQRGVGDVENRTAAQLNSLRRQVKDLEIERDKLQGQIETASGEASSQLSRLQQDLERERAGRVQANESVRNLEKRIADLEAQLAISGEEREEQVRELLAERERELAQTEAERIRLAERVSLLQAALSSKDGELRRLKAEPAEKRKGRVVSLVRDRLAEGGEPQDEVATRERETADLIRQRQSDLDKLSERWKQLQEAYREAVAEFDDVRAKRDRLLRKLGRESKGEIPSAPEAPPKTEPPAEQPAPPPPAASDEPPPSAASDEPSPREGEQEDTWVVQESAPRRLTLIQLDDDPKRVELVQAVASEHGVRFGTGADVEVAPGGELLVAANLLAETLEIPDLLAEIARDERAIRAVLYAAAGRHGRVFGTADVFPAPFDPKVCAPFLLATYKRLRRVMTVGDSLDTMSQLRELLGQSRCSTAVAFDPRQAFDLISLVRPEYVLIDLSMPAGGGFELLVDLSKRSDAALKVGLTWSRPLEAATLRSEIGKRCGHENLDPVQLAGQIAALLEAEPARS